MSAIDLSAVALERAAERAAARGTRLACIVTDWHEHDFGEAAFELVVVSFMHPQPNDREALFERVARALVPGGHVFTVGVTLADHGRRGPPDAERLYTLERVQHALRGFELLHCEEHFALSDTAAVARAGGGGVREQSIWRRGVRSRPWLNGVDRASSRVRPATSGRPPRSG